MDATRFDRWTRGVATARSRRGAIEFLLAGALAGTVGSEVVAKDKGKGKGNKGNKGNGKGKGCSNNQKKCGKKCIAKDACCSRKDCNPCALEVCDDGVCGCAGDGVLSNGACGSVPKCLSVGLVTPDPSQCCSEGAIDDGHGQLRCLAGRSECVVHFDCVSGPCRGFKCPELYRSYAGETCP